MKTGFGEIVFGIVHTFVIFVPGALLFASCLYVVRPAGQFLSTDLGTAGWALALAASFILGHFTSWLGSKIERNKPGEKYMAKEAKPELRAAALRILNERLPASVVSSAAPRLGAALLRSEDANSYPEVERSDVDRRFFRNIRIVFVLATLLFAYKWLISVPGTTLGNLAIVCFVSAVLSQARFRYLDQRHTRLVFESLVLQFGIPKGGLKTWEIRWFSESPECEVLKTELSQAGAKVAVHDQPDLYVVSSTRTVGVKLRDQLLETKALVDEECDGSHRYEQWIKYSGVFGRSISSLEMQHGWTRVNKRRMLAKLIWSEKGESQWVDPDSRHDQGCQVEVTELSVQDSSYWSFAIEAFGPESSQLDLVKRARALLQSRLNHFGPLARDAICRSYPEWLRTLNELESGQVPR